MLIFNFENLLPIINKDIKKELLYLFKEEINQKEPNMLILLFQMQIIYDRSDKSKKIKIIEKIDNILN